MVKNKGLAFLTQNFELNVVFQYYMDVAWGMAHIYLLMLLHIQLLFMHTATDLPS